MSSLLRPLESIPPMDVLIALGRGPDDYERAELVADIAESMAAREQLELRARSAEFLGPLVFLCGNEPWHRATGLDAGDQQEAKGMLGHVHSLIGQGQPPKKYGHLTTGQFKTVGGNSTIASMVEIAKDPELVAHPEWSIAFLTDELHNTYGRVGRSALAVFGSTRSLEVITYPRPYPFKEGPMEVAMSLLTRWALRAVTPGNVDEAARAQERIENVVGLIQL